jgi:hypothetical protein
LQSGSTVSHDELLISWTPHTKPGRIAQVSEATLPVLSGGPRLRRAEKSKAFSNLHRSLSASHSYHGKALGGKCRQGSTHLSVSYTHILCFWPSRSVRRSNRAVSMTIQRQKHRTRKPNNKSCTFTIATNILDARQWARVAVFHHA